MDRFKMTYTELPRRTDENEARDYLLKTVTIYT